MNKELSSKIKIVDIGNILPFEWDIAHDGYIGNIDIQKNDIIKHPYLAVAIDQENYLLLEKAEFYYTYLKNGIRHLPLQVCTKSELKTFSNQIGFDGFSVDDLKI